MHIFPYSVRTGTAAARWKQLPPKLVQDRVQTLLQLNDTLSLSYREQLIGRTLNVMLEQRVEKNIFRGRCEHYAEITVKTSANQGELIPAIVIEVTNDITVAQQQLQIIS